MSRDCPQAAVEVEQLARAVFRAGGQLGPWPLEDNLAEWVRRAEILRVELAFLAVVPLRPSLREADPVHGVVQALLDYYHSKPEEDRDWNEEANIRAVASRAAAVYRPQEGDRPSPATGTIATNDPEKLARAKGMAESLTTAPRDLSRDGVRTIGRPERKAMSDSPEQQAVVEVAAKAMAETSIWFEPPDPERENRVKAMAAVEALLDSGLVKVVRKDDDAR